VRSRSPAWSADATQPAEAEERTMVILHARVPVKPEARERWLELLAAVTPPSRAEDACQSYVVYEAVESPNAFIFVEQWASIEGLHAHFHTPHFGAFFGGLGDVLAGPPEGTVSDVSSTQTLDEVMAAAGVTG
jgi:quinol monooxygenase YgiN